MGKEVNVINSGNHCWWGRQHERPTPLGNLQGPAPLGNLQDYFEWQLVNIYIFLTSDFGINNRKGKDISITPDLFFKPP